MSDYADRYADKRISEVDRELKKTYRTAQQQLKKKLAAFNRKFAEKSREKQQQLADGKITKKEYQDWLTGQVFIRSKIDEQLKLVNAVMLDHNKQAMNLINTANLDVFAEGYNYNAYLTEMDIMASFQVYNTQAVARLILGDPDLLPKWKIDEKKDYQWNSQRVNNIIRQGIIQGKGVSEITDDLCIGLATKNYNKMRMFARTAIGSAEEAGRQKQMDDLADMGVEVFKKWLATHDNVTRDSHRAMDGEEVPYNKPFSNGLMFPKDPTGAPGEIYNCRCVMRTVIQKYEKRDNYWRTNDVVDGKSYKDWKKFDTYADWKKWKEEHDQIKKYGSTPKVDYEFGSIPKDQAESYKKAFGDISKRYPLKNKKIGWIGDFRVPQSISMDEDYYDILEKDSSLDGIMAEFMPPSRYHEDSRFRENPYIKIYNPERPVSTLKETLDTLVEIRKKYGWKSKSDSYFDTGLGTEAIFVHEYGHAVAYDCGLYRGGKYYSKLEEIFNSHTKEEIGRDISIYGASIPDEMLAEAFVLGQDIRTRTPLVVEIMDLIDWARGQNK